MKEIKLGIIGSNFVADWMCDSIDKTDGIANHAIFSRTAERGNEFAARHNIPNVYTSLEDFLSSDIDAVYIASPNFLHAPYAVAAMDHGLHVIVEKPAALSEAEFVGMEEAAERNGVVLMEAMRPIHDPVIKVIRGAMKEIGTIRRASFEFCQYSSRYDRFKAGEIMNAFDPSLGNAALMDIGVYAVACMVYLLGGKPDSIYSKSVILHNGMEGMGSIFLDYGSAQAEVVYSKITESYNPSSITGEDGTILIGKLSTLENVRLCRRLKNTGNGQNDTSEETLAVSGDQNNMIFEAADFVKLIRGGCSEGGEWNRITRESLRIMDEVRRQSGIVFPGVNV